MNYEAVTGRSFRLTGSLRSFYGAGWGQGGGWDFYRCVNYAILRDRDEPFETRRVVSVSACMYGSYFTRPSPGSISLRGIFFFLFPSSSFFFLSSCGDLLRNVCSEAYVGLFYERSKTMFPNLRLALSACVKREPLVVRKSTSSTLTALMTPG